MKRLLMLLAAALLTLAPLCAFAATQSGYTYTVVTGEDGVKTATITKYNASAAEVVVPDTLGGYPVTVIEENAFSSKTMTAVTLPDTLKTIGFGAFQGCSKLTGIVIPDSVASIGNSAFYNCSSLTSVTLPKGLTEISGSVFSSCRALASITLPDTLTTIRSSAFSGCTALTELHLPDSLSSIESYAFAYETKLVCAMGSTPALALSGGKYSYYGQTRPYRFYPDPASGVAYRYGANDETVLYLCAVPKDCVTFAVPQGVTAIDDSAFSGCTQLENIFLPEGVTSIGNYAFSGCTALTELRLPSAVTSIGNYAFNNCSNLAFVHLPENVTSFGTSFLQNCPALLVCNPSSVTAKTYTAQNTNYYVTDSPESGVLYRFPDDTLIASKLTEAGKTAERITLAEGTHTIGGSLFKDNATLKHLILPDSVTKIAAYAFKNCTSLSVLHLPDGISELGTEALYGCTAKLVCNPLSTTATQMTAREFTDSEDSPFRYIQSYSGLELRSYLGSEEQIAVPEFVSSIYQGIWSHKTLRWLILHDALAYAPSLPNTITVTPVCSPDSQTAEKLTSAKLPFAAEVGSPLLYLQTEDGGVSLVSCDAAATEIMVPDYVTNIAYPGFTACTALKSITLPDQISGITYSGSTSPFKGYTGMLICDFDSTTAKTLSSHHLLFTDSQDSPFRYSISTTYDLMLSDYTGDEQHVIVPQGVSIIDEYAFAYGKVQRITLPESVTDIHSYAFAYSALTEIDLPDTLTYIAQAAFRSSALQSITLPASLRALDKQVFSKCSALETVTFSSGLTTIPDEAFLECAKLDTVVLPDTLSSIGQYAFEDCSAMSAMVIPDNLNRIGYGAFLRCSARMICPIGSAAATLLGSNSLSFTDPAYPTLSLRYAADGTLSVREYFGTQNTVSIPEEATAVSFYSSQTKPVAFLLHDGVTSVGSASSDVLCVCRLDSTTAKTLSEEDISFTDSPDSPLRYRIYDAGLMVDGFDRSTDTVVIPDTVVGITGSGFSALGRPTVIHLPDNLSSVSASLFDRTNAIVVCGLNSQTAKKLGDALPGFTDSPDSPFRYGTSYNSLYLLRYVGDSEVVSVPYGVAGVEEKAFSGLADLRRVILPNSLFSLAQYAFHSCPSLTTIVLSPRIETASNPLSNCPSFAGFEGVSGTRGEELATRHNYAFTAVDISLPADTVSVKAEAFAGSGLRAATVPAGCTSIGARAFADCPRLVCVRIPESVTSIGEDAFAGCAHLVILAKSGSYAEQYAKDNGIAVSTIN